MNSSTAPAPAPVSPTRACPVRYRAGPRSQPSSRRDGIQTLMIGGRRVDSSLEAKVPLALRIPRPTCCKTEPPTPRPSPDPHRVGGNQLPARCPILNFTHEKRKLTRGYSQYCPLVSQLLPRVNLNAVGSLTCGDSVFGCEYEQRSEDPGHHPGPRGIKGNPAKKPTQDRRPNLVGTGN